MKFIIDYLGENPNLTVSQLFTLLQNTKSDINEHMGTLKRYSSMCEHVTEMGTRHCMSTMALLAGEPSTLVCYDWKKTETVDYVLALPKETKLSFHVGNTLEISIENTEILFIDTLHTYSQLKTELELHGNKAQRFLAFHDTEVFGNRDGHGYNGPGLLPAINEFMKQNPHWSVKERFTNNNGLLILERK